MPQPELPAARRLAIAACLGLFLTTAGCYVHNYSGEGPHRADAEDGELNKSGFGDFYFRDGQRVYVDDLTMKDRNK